MNSRLLAIGSIVLALISLPAAADQTEELARLREEAAELRHSLNRLDARIEALQNQSRNPTLSKNVEPSQPPPAPPAPLAAPAGLLPIVSLKRNWSQIERGIPQQTVQSLLGEPEKVLRIDGNTVWYYTYPGLGRGSVFFSDDGKVSSVQSPSFGWGW